MEMVDRIIMESRERHLEPHLVDIYFDKREDFLKIKERFSDHGHHDEN